MFRLRPMLAVMVLCVALPASGAAREDPPPIRTVTFDHFLQTDGGTSLVELEAGEQFRVVLAHTCPEAFDYRLRKLPKVEKDRDIRTFTDKTTGRPANPSMAITRGPIKHEAKWGSYILEVVAREGRKQTKCDVWVDGNGVPIDPPKNALANVDDVTGGHWDKEVKLEPALFVLAVQSSDWEVGVDAGPVFAFGTDRKFTTGPSPADPAKKIVVEDVDGQSSARLAIGTLTHFYMPGRSHGPVAGFSILSAGSGSPQGNQTEYYIGWGFGIGPRKFRLNAAAGAAYAAVSALPAGIKLGDPITDATTIATLRNVYRWRLFVAFSGSAFRTGEDSKPPAPNSPGK